MDVENSFLEEGSDDTGDEPKTTQTKHVNAPRKMNKNRGHSETIRIAPIPRHITEADLVDLIKSECQRNVVSIRFVFNKNKRHTKNKESNLWDAQCAFIVLESKEDATFVQQKLHKTFLPNETFKLVVKIVGATKSVNAEMKGQTTWVRLSGFAHEITEQDILTHIQTKAKIKQAPKTVLLRQHPRNDTYPGFALIECASAKDAIKCVDKLKMSKLKGKKIWTRYSGSVAKKGREDQMFDRNEKLAGKTKNVLIGNVHWSATFEEMMALCEEFGELWRVIVWYDKTGYTRGVMTAMCKDEETATKVFEGMHGKQFKNMPLRTSYTDIKRVVKEIKEKKKKAFTTKVMRTKGLVKKMSKMDVDDKKTKGGSHKNFKKRMAKKKSKGKKGGMKFA